MGNKLVYMFWEGSGKMRELLGGKGANLSEMTNLGLPVPQGFVVTTEACNEYYALNGKISEELKNQVAEYIKKLEEITGKGFGDSSNPLLVSVRSGSRASMPGMMDTVLNLGLNDEVVEALAKLTDNPRFAYDSYRRFIQMFADVVMEIPKHQFEVIIDQMKAERNITDDADFTADDYKEMVDRFKAYYLEHHHESFPTNPFEQLMESITAVFRSWNNDRAVYYRRINDIPSAWGTAVNVQEMVFGNMGDTCATGVAFTRNPATGEKKLFGEFLVNAQGEDVVAGTRTPLPMEELQALMPEAFAEFERHCETLENHYKDMQDMEFTIENHKLYMLQTRSGKRTANAALKIAVDLVEEGLITEKEAVLQIDPKQLDALLHPHFNENALKAGKVIGTGLAASPGAASGRIVFTAEEAKEYTSKGDKVILVRLETSPEDIEGMALSEGILTARGGMTSHAAVVARGMGTCCVSGSSDLSFHGDVVKIGEENYQRGDFISLDGTTGKIYDGLIESEEASISGDFEKFMTWADSYRTMGVRTNADSPKDAKQALEFGAEGIGLVRTEHMFFEGNRIKAVREMILSRDEAGRRKALDKLLPIQQADFEGIYEVMKELPVTIRYLDPPLHEFLPTKEEEMQELADDMGHSLQEIKDVVASLHEFNPMMGHRGVRLAISYPEIAEMQTKAVIRAALAVQERLNIKVNPEIMIPLVGAVKELEYVKEVVDRVAKEEIEASGQELHYAVGTMIEIPRACVIADKIAEQADFFSFGTNDLTQMTFGYSRDDIGTFLPIYLDKGILKHDPFQVLDQEGVGQLVQMGTQRGRSVKPDLKVGICGEHGGEPSSVKFCHRVGMNYVSCSPYRVPIARLAAAQAAIE